jgi:hypothetical protein
MTTEYEDIHEVEQFLAHYGVKGMQWGKRRPVGANGRVVGRTRSGYAKRKDATGDKKLAKARASRDKSRAKLKESRAKNEEGRAFLKRVGTGKATTQENLLYYSTVNLIDLAGGAANLASGSGKASLRKAYADNRRGMLDSNSKGLDNYGKRKEAKATKRIAKAKDIKAHAKRVNTGKATAKDNLKFYGTAKLLDTIKG